jgi:hypothetical protein
MEKIKYNEVQTIVHAKNHLHTQFCRTTLCKNSSAYVGIEFYNKLPNTIKRLEKIQEFKRRLEYFLQQQFYIQWMNIHPLRFYSYSFIIMYTLFLVFINFTKQYTKKKKLYIIVCVLITLYITVFHC